MAKIQNIDVYRKEDIGITFTLDPVESIAGWTTVFTVRKSYQSPTTMFTINGVITDASGGVFSVTIPAATMDIAPGRYVFDAVRTNVGNVAVLAIGEFNVRSGVRTP